MNGVVGLGGTLALLLVAGGLIGLADRRHFAPRWLLAAAGLVAANDALLTNLYGLLPDLVGGERNWQGKGLALAATLEIAALPAFGWRRVGLTLAHAPGSLRSALGVAFLYGAVFVALALMIPNEPARGEEVGFQLTMPGLEEEPFYRGVLLFALGRAFTARVRWLGVEWDWGAILSCALFGLAHAFGFSRGSFGFDPLVFALTALPSLVAVWLRLRAGSLVLPVAMHKVGNSASLFL